LEDTAGLAWQIDKNQKRVCQKAEKSAEDTQQVPQASDDPKRLEAKGNGIAAAARNETTNLSRNETEKKWSWYVQGPPAHTADKRSASSGIFPSRNTP
jgi:hypothetical protein